MGSSRVPLIKATTPNGKTAEVKGEIVYQLLSCIRQLTAQLSGFSRWNQHNIGSQEYCTYNSMPDLLCSEPRTNRSATYYLLQKNEGICDEVKYNYNLHVKHLYCAMLRKCWNRFLTDWIMIRMIWNDSISLI